MQSVMNYVRRKFLQRFCIFWLRIEEMVLWSAGRLLPVDAWGDSFILWRIGKFQPSR